jgi:hypothetical protein
VNEAAPPADALLKTVDLFDNAAVGAACHLTGAKIRLPE